MLSNALPIPNNNAIPISVGCHTPHRYRIDKATVSHHINLAQVTRHLHGNTWFINYDELEKVILRHLKAVKKRKKIQLNIAKGRTVRLALLNY